MAQVGVPMILVPAQSATSAMPVQTVQTVQAIQPMQTMQTIQAIQPTQQVVTLDSSALVAVAPQSNYYKKNNFISTNPFNIQII